MSDISLLNKLFGKPTTNTYYKRITSSYERIENLLFDLESYGISYFFQDNDIIKYTINHNNITYEFIGLKDSEDPDYNDCGLTCITKIYN